MSDIIERLHGPDGMEAGREIARLREENARLREAQAKEIAELKEMMRALIIIVEFSNMADSSRELTSHARAALKGEK